MILIIPLTARIWCQVAPLHSHEEVACNAAHRWRLQTSKFCERLSSYPAGWIICKMATVLKRWKAVVLICFIIKYFLCRFFIYSQTEITFRTCYLLCLAAMFFLQTKVIATLSLIMINRKENSVPVRSYIEFTKIFNLPREKNI